jgi:hypothetical protein
MLKCHVCGADVPIFGSVLWCDGCIEEYLASGLPMDEFIARKREEARHDA